ncbi:MAG: hypothetical protein EZS28_040899 [Streblomastix strix]|uniref:Right handed beta helix domain-containing protein n=1 Tax=Streblomastix strix TaxID=222440 RepID=A0A5J4TZF2_9EUKA|nr:MAG: hypothetical protein EZS28_040899 [Streblomastix strix]
MNNFNGLILQNCRFKDALIKTSYEAVSLVADRPFTTISIQDCEFINIISINLINCASALSIFAVYKLRLEIKGNNFTSCGSDVTEIGALSVIDYLDELEEENEFTIVNNRFAFNKGKFAGAFQLISHNPLSSYYISNNKFLSNRNDDSSGFGQDIYLNFTSAPEDWTRDNLIDKIKSIINESTSDAVLDSVSVYAMINYSYCSRNVSISVQPPPLPIQPLPIQPFPPVGKQGLSGLIIAGIVAGAVIIVIVVVVIIIGIIVHRKVLLCIY